jgi:hypothetical protein
VVGHEAIAVMGRDQEIAAQEEAARLILLARCPRCGRRGPTAVRELIGGSIALALAGVVLLAVAAGLLALGPPDRSADKLVATCAVGGAAVIGFAFTRVRSRWRGSDERVRFL